jgi:hypothetical protein
VYLYGSSGRPAGRGAKACRPPTVHVLHELRGELHGTILWVLNSVPSLGVGLSSGPMFRNLVCEAFSHARVQKPATLHCKLWKPPGLDMLPQRLTLLPAQHYSQSHSTDTHILVSAFLHPTCPHFRAIPFSFLDVSSVAQWPCVQDLAALCTSSV